LKPLNLPQGVSLVTHYLNNLLDYSHLNYLNQWSDQIHCVAVASRANSLIHPTFQTHWPRWNTVEDPTLEWVTSIRDFAQIDQTVEQIATQLRCQALYYNTKLVNCWFQPLENHWQHFFNHHTNQQLIQQFGPLGIEWLQGQDKSNPESTFYPFNGITMDRRIPQLRSYMLYYKLQPNKELEQCINQLLS
jgi:hypothetical protein